MRATALTGIFAAFFWTAFRSAGVDPADWNITLLALAVLALLVLRRSQAPPLERGLFWPLALLSACPLFQLAPLPAALVRLLSPAAAALSSAAASAIPATAPSHLSVFPAATLVDWMRLAGAVLVFLIVRELTWRFSGRSTPWIVVLPLVVIACLEAGLGLVQYYTGAAPGGAHGTYASRDHFAGLLEIALPFPVMYAMAVLWRGRKRFTSPVRPALLASGSFAAAALLLLGTIHSLSRMGFIAALCALGVLAASAVHRKAWLLLIPAALAVLFIYLPPNDLIARFADLSTTEKISAQDRLEVWRETVPLALAYPLTGCGLGAYESAFMPFKRKTPLLTDSYAHNDYLQYLAELGLPGFGIGLFLLVRILAAALRAAARHASPAGRALALACFASLAALLVHSLVDFNSYIPANAFALSWVAALATSSMFSSRPGTPASELEVNITPGS